MPFHLDGESFATFGSTSIDDSATGFCGHPLTEAMGSCPFDSARLKCSFHFYSFILGSTTTFIYTQQRLRIIVQIDLN
jgi:hypothetical protein